MSEAQPTPRQAWRAVSEAFARERRAVGYLRRLRARSDNGSGTEADVNLAREAAARAIHETYLALSEHGAALDRFFDETL